MRTSRQSFTLMVMRGLLLSIFFCGFATAAAADPCEAIPEGGPLPGYLSFGARFSGQVVHVIDGDSLCVAVGPEPSQWVEVRLGDFHAVELKDPGGAKAKAMLERVATGRQASCVASLRTYDRIAARCPIDGRPVGDSLRAAGSPEGGNGQVAATPMTRGLSVGSGVSAGGFRSCAAARAAGAAPLRRGTPGYNPNLDGDNDGIACEPYRGR